MPGVGGGAQNKEEELSRLPPELPRKQRKGRGAWPGGVASSSGSSGAGVDLCPRQAPTWRVAAPGNLLLFVSFSPLEKQGAGLSDP